MLTRVEVNANQLNVVPLREMRANIEITRRHCAWALELLRTVEGVLRVQAENVAVSTNHTTQAKPTPRGAEPTPDVARHVLKLQRKTPSVPCAHDIRRGQTCKQELPAGVRSWVGVMHKRLNECWAEFGFYIFNCKKCTGSSLKLWGESQDVTGILRVSERQPDIASSRLLTIASMADQWPKDRTKMTVPQSEQPNPLFLHVGSGERVSSDLEQERKGRKSRVQRIAHNETKIGTTLILLERRDHGVVAVDTTANNNGEVVYSAVPCSAFGSVEQWSSKSHALITAGIPSRLIEHGTLVLTRFTWNRTRTNALRCQDL